MIYTKKYHKMGYNGLTWEYHMRMPNNNDQTLRYRNVMGIFWGYSTVICTQYGFLHVLLYHSTHSPHKSGSQVCHLEIVKQIVSIQIVTLNI
jgi:hypothetical protein